MPAKPEQIRIAILDDYQNVALSMADWRQHERVTKSDRMAEGLARAFHIGTEPPKIVHLIHAKY